jgi:glycolate oxidase FAD binding subunit
MVNAATAQMLHAESPQHAIELLQQAHQQGQSVMPCGQRSRQARVLPNKQVDCWLSMAQCTRLLWLDIADQTCEIEAGMSAATLAAHLEGTGLELPILCRGDTSGTLGGVWMAAEPSLLAESCGYPRDLVLGAGWILADGTRVRSGARVVKSVAGYDVTRLLLGSRGQLAINTSLILRLRPVPKKLFWYQLPADTWPNLRDQLPQPRLLLPAANGHDLFLQYAEIQPVHHALSAADSILAEQQLSAFVEEMKAPLPQASPWLKATAEACAPGAPHFGSRP